MIEDDRALTAEAASGRLRRAFGNRLLHMALNEAHRPMMPMQAMHRRFLNRAIRDLPDDLDLDVEDVLGVLRAFVRVQQNETTAGASADQQHPWASPARFGLPGSPPSSRVTSPRGERSFHLTKNETVTRTAAQFDRYAKDKVATLNDDAPEQGRNLALSAADRDEYILGHGGETPAKQPAFLTTLDPDDQVRARQWDDVEAFELEQRINPDGKPAKVSVFYERDPAFFDRAAAAAECPTGLRKVIERARRRFDKGKAPGERSANLGVGWESDDAQSVFAWLAGLPGWQGDHPEHRLARYSEGRGTQTVLAMEGEYCEELDDAARDRIRTNLNDFLQRQRNPGDDLADGSFIPVMIADHLPGRLNDSRNVHFHLQTGVRRATLDGEELEFAERKVDAMTRDTFIPLMRAEFARLSNVELDAINAPYRLHPGTLKQMGCSEETPQRKLGQKATVLERASVPTDRGWSNDLEAWERIMRAADREHQRDLAAIDVKSADGRLREPGGERQAALESAVRELREAAVLRHEARRIEIMIEMARSRPVRTELFAPAYAEASRGRNVAGWLGRYREAVDWLERLDRDLDIERAEVVTRRAMAADKDAAANALFLAKGGEARLVRSNPHRAVELIVDAPLLITRERGRFFVAPDDDENDLVAGVDLSSVQKRVAALYHVQQRELAQVAAFVGRHGAVASPAELLGRPSVWLERSWQRWAGTAAFARMAMNPEDRLGSTAQKHIGELSTIADFPALADLPVLGGGIEPSAPEGAAITTVRAEPATEPPISTSPEAPPQAVPTPVTWSDDERRLLRLVEFSITKDREAIARGLDRALSERAGPAGQVTPFTALLLRRIFRGFDPAMVEVVSETGCLTHDQHQAGEIAALSRVPHFAQLVKRARAGDPALKLEVEQAASSTDPYRHGRVKIVDDAVQFDPARFIDLPLYLPQKLIRPALAQLETGAIPLSRHAGLTGVFDPAVLELTDHNYVPLLYPAVQARLEVTRRIQTEERREVLTRIAAGELKVQTRLELNPSSKVPTARVAITSRDFTQTPFIRRLVEDPTFYFDCRLAQEAANSTTSLRHPAALVRAYLGAIDERAEDAVLTLMRRRLKAARPSIDISLLSEKDRRVIAAALAPAPKAPRQTYPRPRRRGSFHRPGDWSR